MVALAGTAHAAGAWSTLGGNAQHTGLSTTAAQPIAALHWSTPVDLTPQSGTILIHYGSPVITAANTVIIPIKTGTGGGFRVDARKGGDGSLLWTAATDYLLPPHSWTPSYSPALAPGGRVYFPGAGGTILYRDNLDAAAPTTSGRLAFYGLANYQSFTAAFDATVFVNTPIVADANGTIWFGFRTTAGAPGNLPSGIARIDAAGNGTWTTAFAASGNNPSINVVPHQAAPALSNDESTLYVVVASSSGIGGYLVGLDPATLAPKEASPGVPMRVALKDPRSGGINSPQISDNSSAVPMVGPDGDVYYGVLGNPFNGSRGWLLHYSANLQQTKPPGAFGWDNTAAVVPASAVPSYTGTSSYLVFSKYNDYAGFDGGAGVNRIAVLDPNATMVEPHPSSGGTLVMKEILTIAGPTPDAGIISSFPNAVREWCINAAAVDPFTKAVMVNSEDGKLYRWDLATNTLSQSVTLSAGILEAYTSTQIGPDGTVYAINWAVLNAVGWSGPAPIFTGAASRKTHGNPGTAFDLALAAPPPAATIEPRSGASGNPQGIVFTFNKPVTGGSATVTEGTAIAGTPTFSGNEMFVPLSAVDNAQRVTIAVTGVVAGDGTGGGSAAVRIGFLAGDVDQSGAVTLSDLLSVNAFLTQPLGAASYLRDVDVSGALTLSDKLLVNANLTQTLPPP